MELLQYIILTLFIIATGAFAAVSLFRKPTFYQDLEDQLAYTKGQMVNIPAERRESLNRIRDYILQRMYKGNQGSILFICAENCGRSILAQVWLEVMARAYELPNLLSYSGGTQPDQLKENMVEALAKAGLQIEMKKDVRGKHLQVRLGSHNKSLHVFSKFFDHVSNPKKNFVAVTTDHFTEEFLDRIPGAHLQVPLTYDRPEGDNDVEALSATVATEMMYLAREIKRALDPNFVLQTAVKPEPVKRAVRVAEGHTVAA